MHFKFGQTHTKQDFSTVFKIQNSPSLFILHIDRRNFGRFCIQNINGRPNFIFSLKLTVRYCNFDGKVSIAFVWKMYL